MTQRGVRVCRWEGDYLILVVRVRPRSPRAELTLDGGGLRLSLQGPPVEGRANQEALALLAKAFGVSRRRIELLAGERSRVKRFRIHRPVRLPCPVQAMLNKNK